MRGLCKCEIRNTHGLSVTGPKGDITWETQMSENNIRLTLKKYDVKRGLEERVLANRIINLRVERQWRGTFYTR
jgi:hypothetical protein